MKKFIKVAGSIFICFALIALGGIGGYMIQVGDQIWKAFINCEAQKESIRFQGNAILAACAASDQMLRQKLQDTKRRCTQ